jgi:hypothetical protein
MDPPKAHYMWMEQCEATHSIRERYGVAAAFDYLVPEKLLNFAGAAAAHPEFARLLPRFVSEVRLIFTSDEIGVHLARVEREQDEGAVGVGDDDEEDIFDESPAKAAEREIRFALVKELSTAPTLGTS